MTLPSLLFGIITSTLYGALFHLWRGGSAGRLVLYILLAWAGFWVGHTIAIQLKWTFASIGPLRFGMATIGSLLFLGIGYWLSLVEVDRHK
jgi:hypothetical protein